MEITLDRPLDVIDDDSPHSLLEPPSPAYTNVTVRRAFIVWMYCGQRNRFQDVCNYYHYLESMEEKLPADRRALSRHHEFDMFTNPPPTSKYLNEIFPELYSYSHIQPSHVNKLESIKNEQYIFNLEGFKEIPQQKGATAREIVEASKIIRKYCITQMIPLRRFLIEFKEFATRCELKNTVNNVATYIKRKMVQAELDIVHNYPKTFNFLESPQGILEREDDIGNTADAGNNNTIYNKDIKPDADREINENLNRNNVNLNDNSAAFFSFFNARCLEKTWIYDKNTSCSAYNVGKEKAKSRSVESLLQHNSDLKSIDSVLFGSHFTNVDDMVRFRRI